VLARRVDGMIFGDAYVDGRFLDEVAARGVPFVLVSRRAGRHVSVTCDDYEGGRLAAEHLLARGHRSVAVIAGEPYASTGIDRTAGFVDTYRDAGLRIPPERILHSRFDARGGRLAAEELLGTGRRPTAIFAVNDFAAIGALGLLAGTDLAVVGFNDTPLAAELPIALTTVRSPMHEMGRRGMELLVKLIRGDEVAAERLRPELMVRASSGADLPHPTPAAGD